MKHLRDAFILIFIADLFLIVAATGHSYASALPLPLTIAVKAVAATLYLATVTLVILAGLSVREALR